MTFASLISRVASNDPSLVELEVSRGTPGIRLLKKPSERIQRIVAALTTNTHVKSLKFIDLQLSETDIAPLAELLKTRAFEGIDLASNKLTGEILLPALVARKSLRVLRLSLALEQLSALSSLKELDLHSCGLSAGSLAGLQLPNLEVLKLGGNLLKTLPDSFASLRNLKQLEVSCCGFSEFPAVLLSLANLENLNISYNQLTSIPENIAVLCDLKVFFASFCGLKEFPLAVTRLVRLENLDLSYNKDIQRVPEEIGNLRSLKVLRISNCALTALPAALWTLGHLEVLYLSSNPLTLRPGGVGALSKLKQLYVYECSIRKLPSEMQQLSSLEVLDIRYTGIAHLPVWLASLRSLKELRSYFCFLPSLAVNEDTLVTFGELAALLSDSSDPEEVEKVKRSFEEMLDREQLRLLRIANMHFAPRTPLRALCMSKCVAQHSRLDLQRLPAHIRDEIVRAAGVVEQ